MIKYVSFTKTHLLIVVSGVAIYDWNTIREMLTSAPQGTL